MHPNWLYDHLPRREILFVLLLLMAVMAGICMRDCTIGAHGYRVTVQPMPAPILPPIVPVPVVP